MIVSPARLEFSFMQQPRSSGESRCTFCFSALRSGRWQSTAACTKAVRIPLSTHDKCFPPGAPGPGPAVCDLRSERPWIGPSLFSVVQLKPSNLGNWRPRAFVFFFLPSAPKNQHESRRRGPVRTICKPDLREPQTTACVRMFHQISHLWSSHGCLLTSVVATTRGSPSHSARARAGTDRDGKIISVFGLSQNPADGVRFPCRGRKTGSFGDKCHLGLIVEPHSPAHRHREPGTIPSGSAVNGSTVMTENAGSTRRQFTP